MVQNGNGALEIMEKLNSDYKMRLMTSTGDPLGDFKDDVDIIGHVDTTDPYFGVYTSATEYIVFNMIGKDGSEVPDATQLRILKVKITHGGQSLTALFTK